MRRIKFNKLPVYNKYDRYEAILSYLEKIKSRYEDSNDEEGLKNELEFLIGIINGL